MTDQQTLNEGNLTLHIWINTYYAYQDIRKASYNRLRDIIYRVNEGISLNASQDKKETKSYGKEYADANLPKLWKKLTEDGKIDEKTASLIQETINLVKESKNFETKYKKLIHNWLKEQEIYKKFLKQIKGIGPIIVARLIKNFGDCSQYDTSSKLWAHCGYGVEKDGTAPKKQKGKEISYNPKLRTFVWNISDSLMKLNKNGFYRQTYVEEKERQLAEEYEKGYLASKWNGYQADDTKLSKGHAHARALRKMVKIFLDHYWVVARTIAGLETEKNYVEGVLGHIHIVSWKDALKMEI